jgi:hypothetical protein
MVLAVASFRKEIVEKHIRKKHPGCPAFAVEHFATLIAGRDWKGASLGAAVGITMQSVLRHQMTDYDQLLLAGVEREEARRRVQGKINKMLGEWKRRAPSQ